MENLPKEQQKTSSNKQRFLVMKALNIATEFGFIIALPLIFFGYLGKFLDRKYGTSYLVLIGVVVAVISSTTWLSQRIKDILKDLKK